MTNSNLRGPKLFIVPRRQLRDGYAHNSLWTHYGISLYSRVKAPRRLPLAISPLVFQWGERAVCLDD
jgi:hypothetical protein